MTGVTKPPRSQEGESTYEVPTPADRTESGQEEVVSMTFGSKVQTTRRMTDSYWVDWEIETARESLEHAERALENRSEFSQRDADALSSSVAHAINAWCRTHLDRAGPSNFDDTNAFLDNAPPDLTEITGKARSAIHSIRWFSRASPAEATAAVRSAVDAVLNAVAAAPPRP